MSPLSFVLHLITLTSLEIWFSRKIPTQKLVIPTVYEITLQTFCFVFFSRIRHLYKILYPMVETHFYISTKAAWILKAYVGFDPSSHFSEVNVNIFTQWLLRKKGGQSSSLIIWKLQKSSLNRLTFFNYIYIYIYS